MGAVAAPFFVGERRVRVVASRIQGITVEIGGDTTKLSTALSKVNKEIRDTQAQLKDVNKLLKLDLGNGELMAQKQRLLAQAVGETREKLEALRLAGQQANEALAKGEISRSQYDALQREKVSVGDFDTETLEMKEAEMFVEGYKAVLVKDTSFKGLWKVSFTLKEF